MRLFPESLQKTCYDTSNLERKSLPSYYVDQEKEIASAMKPSTNTSMLIGSA